MVPKIRMTLKNVPNAGKVYIYRENDENDT